MRVLSVPKVLFLALQKPAKVFVSSSDLRLDQNVRLNGVAVQGNDTPWCALADLLIDSADRRLVGLTFAIEDSSYWEPMRRIAEKLDPNVVRYEDISSPDAKRIYSGESGKVHRLEITWSAPKSPAMEVAQLLCGQWFWWYATDGNWGVCPPIVSLGISDLHAVLADHNLGFPEHLAFPPLDLRV